MRSGYAFDLYHKCRSFDPILVQKLCDWHIPHGWGSYWSSEARKDLWYSVCAAGGLEWPSYAYYMMISLIRYSIERVCEISDGYQALKYHCESQQITVSKKRVYKWIQDTTNIVPLSWIVFGVLVTRNIPGPTRVDSNIRPCTVICQNAVRTAYIARRHSPVRTTTVIATRSTSEIGLESTMWETQTRSRTRRRRLCICGCGVIGSDDVDAGK